MTLKATALDELGDELKNITNINTNLLCTIKSCQSKKVVSDYTYSINFNLPSTPRSAKTVHDINEETWSLTSKKYMEDVSKRLD
eukprot:4966084-Ditylum_brightwellii.AAC.1